MRIFIAGQKAFGAAVFDFLHKEGHDIAGVSVPLFRDDGVRPDRLRLAALDAHVSCMVAGTLRAATLPDGVDLIVAAHSYDYISRKTLMRAKLGGIGYHPSLLPLHRGRDAIRWAILMRDHVTGGSVYWLNDNVDGGPIAAQDWCFIRPGDDAESLWRRDLFPMGLRLFKRVMGDLGRGVVRAIPQEKELATWEPSWERPPLYRPDLPMIGPAPVGFRYIVSGEEQVST